MRTFYTQMSKTIIFIFFYSSSSYLSAHELTFQDHIVVIVNVVKQYVSVVYVQHMLNYVIQLNRELSYLFHLMNTIVIYLPMNKEITNVTKYISMNNRCHRKDKNGNIQIKKKETNIC
jgi:hypothetical protein